MNKKGNKGTVIIKAVIAQVLLVLLLMVPLILLVLLVSNRTVKERVRVNVSFHKERANLDMPKIARYQYVGFKFISSEEEEKKFKVQEA